MDNLKFMKKYWPIFLILGILGFIVYEAWQLYKKATAAPTAFFTWLFTLFIPQVTNTQVAVASSTGTATGAPLVGGGLATSGATDDAPASDDTPASP